MRDTYRDCVTYQDFVKGGSASNLLETRRRELAERSGAVNVPNAIIRTEHDFSRDALIMRVSFDSRAWTGRA